MKECYLELKKAQKLYDDKKEDEILLKCIKCKNFNKKENGYYCLDNPIRILNI